MVKKVTNRTERIVRDKLIYASNLTGLSTRALRRLLVLRFLTQLVGELNGRAR